MTKKVRHRTSFECVEMERRDAETIANLHNLPKQCFQIDRDASQIKGLGQTTGPRRRYDALGKGVAMQGSIGWGILGTGNIARQFAAGMQTARRGSLVAVASRSDES